MEEEREEEEEEICLWRAIEPTGLQLSSFIVWNE